MAPRPRAGRKPAKNETANSLLTALTFLGVLKPPTGQALQPYMTHVFMNEGWAIGFDGILAAGHTIETGINGYVNTKLLGEALDNTEKTFTLTVLPGGHFHIESGKYMSLVPAIDAQQVPQTFPDAAIAPFQNPKAFIDAMVASGKVVSDTAEKALYASIRLNGTTVMATDGGTVIEAWHGNNMPSGLVLPKVFALALAKTGKEPTSFGFASDWSTFTVHFADGSWLRTNCFPHDIWPQEVLQAFGGLFAAVPTGAAIDKKLFDAVRAVLPFAEEDRRIIIRPGLVRTHMDRTKGAALELASVNFEIDIDGKRLLAVEDHVETAGVGNMTFVFYGPIVRGVIAGKPALAEEAPAPTVAPGWNAPAQGWGTPPGAAQAQPAPEATPTPGWGGAPTVAFASPPQVATPPQGHNGIPPGGLAGDPEYEAARTGQEVTADEAMVSDFDITAWANNLPKDTGE